MTIVPTRMAADRVAPHRISQTTGPRRIVVRDPSVVAAQPVNLASNPRIYPNPNGNLSTLQPMAFALGNPVSPALIVAVTTWGSAPTMANAELRQIQRGQRG